MLTTPAQELDPDPGAVSGASLPLADPSPLEPSLPPTLPSLPLWAAADLQDNLMTATHDLDRLQTLLADACDAMAKSFYGAIERIDTELKKLGPDVTDSPVPAAFDGVVQQLGGAVTALQFQDMASQLIAHTHQRLRNCADRIANEAMGADEDGGTVVEAPPLRPNPVTQDEMDAGSVELF